MTNGKIWQDAMGMIDESYIAEVIEHRPTHSRLAGRLIRWGFLNFSYEMLIRKNEPAGRLRVTDSAKADTVSLVAVQDLYTVVNDKVDLTAVTRRVVTDKENLTAPVKAGMIVGQAEVYRQGKCIGSAYLVTSSALAKDHSAHLKRSALDFLTSTGFLLTVAIAIIIAIVYVLVIARIRYQRMVKQIMEVPDETEIPPSHNHPQLPSRSDKEHH